MIRWYLDVVIFSYLKCSRLFETIINFWSFCVDIKRSSISWVVLPMEKYPFDLCTYTKWKKVKKKSWLLLWFVCDKFLLIPFKITVILKRKTDQGKKVLRSHRIEKLLTQLSCIRRHNGCAQCVSWRKNIENPCIAKVIEIYSICSSPHLFCSIWFSFLVTIRYTNIHRCGHLIRFSFSSRNATRWREIP